MKAKKSMESKKEHINPKGLFESPAFSQVVTTQGSGKTATSLKSTIS